MKFLWLSWKDAGHPAAGGAEVVLHELCQRLVADGHEVTILTAAYKGAPGEELKDGIRYIRVGANRYLHSLQALGHYLRHLRNQFDVVVEVVNTAPYFSVMFNDRAKRVLLYHQLARDVWFHEMPVGFSHLGYHVFEPLATRALALTKVPTIAMSPSTKADLARFGFKPERTSILGQGVTLPYLPDLALGKKFERPTMLSLGHIRTMKRTLDQLAAFEIAKKRLPDLQLKIAGDASGAYGQSVLRAIEQSPHRADVSYVGRVAPAQKQELMRRSHLITVTSVKEGWGLIVSEAASQGTPAVVYNVDGLRDSVRHNQTGLVTPTDPSALADGIIAMLDDPDRYQTMRRQAWQWARELTFDNSYLQFKKLLEVS